MAYIIAELGSNHCNDPVLLADLIDSAITANCDAIKLQDFKVDRLWKTEVAADARRQYELDDSILLLAYEKAAKAGIDFLVTPFYPEGVARLRPLVSAWKIASAHIGDTELRDAVCEDDKEIYLSTGAIQPESVARYCNEWAFHGNDTRAVTPLNCVSHYPAVPPEYGLKGWLSRAGVLEGLTTWRPWGLSDHTIGIGTAVAAACLGASVIEKHIALEDQPPSPDDGVHALRPPALRAMVAAIHQAEAAILGRRGSIASFAPERRVWR